MDANKTRGHGAAEVLVPIGVSYREERAEDGTCHLSQIDQIAWCKLDASTGARLAPTELRNAAACPDSQVSLRWILDQLEESLTGSEYLFVACGPLPLRQHIHPAAMRAKLTLGSAYDRYADLTKEFARRYGHTVGRKNRNQQQLAPLVTCASCCPDTTGCSSGGLLDIEPIGSSSSCCSSSSEAGGSSSAYVSLETAPATQCYCFQSDLCPSSSRQHLQRAPSAGVQSRLPSSSTNEDGVGSSSCKQVAEMLQFLSIESHARGSTKEQEQNENQAADSQIQLQNERTAQQLADKEREETEAEADSTCCSEADGSSQSEMDSKLADQSAQSSSVQLVDTMSLVIKSMLQEGHKLDRIERIKRRVEIGLCEPPNGRESDKRVVRARGLPWQATEQDIANFFVGLDISRGGVGLCLSRQGRRNGEALIQFESREHRSLALARHKHFMGPRYIEVYRASCEDFTNLAAGYNNKAQAFLSRGAQVIVRMRGLPFTCTSKQVVEFFAGSGKQQGTEVLGHEEGVLFVKNQDEKPTGDAFVLFATEEAARLALQRHRQNIGPRYVELFRSSIPEVQQVLSISLKPTADEPQQPRTGQEWASPTGGRPSGGRPATSGQGATYAQVATSGSTQTSPKERVGGETRSQPDCGVAESDGASLDSDKLSATATIASSAEPCLESASDVASAPARSPTSSLSAGSSGSSSSSSSSSSSQLSAESASHQPPAKQKPEQPNMLQTHPHGQCQAQNLAYQGHYATPASLHYYGSQQTMGRHASYGQAPLAGGQSYRQAYELQSQDQYPPPYPAPGQLSAPGVPYPHALYPPYQMASHRHHYAQQYTMAAPLVGGQQGQPASCQLPMFPAGAPHLYPFFPQAPMDPNYALSGGGKRDCVRLRGLPFEAQVEDVLCFLGDQSCNILLQGVHMVYSASGQPTGEAIIQMNGTAAACATAQQFHRKVMSCGKKQRYIEVLACSANELYMMLGPRPPPLYTPRPAEQPTSLTPPHEPAERPESTTTEPTSSSSASSQASAGPAEGKGAASVGQPDSVDTALVSQSATAYYPIFYCYPQQMVATPYP